MPRFMMGALALTSACLGYFLAARWEDGWRGHFDPAEHIAPDRVHSDAALSPSRPSGPRASHGYGEYPLGV